MRIVIEVFPVPGRGSAAGLRGASRLRHWRSLERAYDWLFSRDEGARAGRVLNRRPRFMTVLDFCEVPRTARKIRARVRLHRPRCMKSAYLKPLIRFGWLRPVPPAPGRHHRRYVATREGLGAVRPFPAERLGRRVHRNGKAEPPEEIVLYLIPFEVDEDLYETACRIWFEAHDVDLGIMDEVFAAAVGSLAAFETTKSLNLPAQGVRRLEIQAGAGSLTVTGREGLAAIEVKAEIVVRHVRDADMDGFLKDRIELVLEMRGDVAVLVSRAAVRGGAPARPRVHACSGIRRGHW